MENGSLLKYIASLSEEEREKYSELIEEALERDRITTEAFCRMRKCFQDFTQNLKFLQRESCRLQKSLVALNQKITEARDSILKNAVADKGQTWN